MKLNTLNSRIRALYNAGFDKELVADMIEKTEGIASADEVFTEGGYISKNVSQELIDDISYNIEKYSDIKKELSKTIKKDTFIGPLSDEQKAKRLVNEYKSKQVFDSKIMDLHNTFYNLVKAVMNHFRRSRVNEDEAVDMIRQTTSGDKYYDALSRLGTAANRMTSHGKYKANPTMSWFQADQAAGNLLAQDTNKILEDVKELYKSKKGVW